MTSGSDLINQNWKQAECEFYAGGTQVAASVAIGSLITQQYWATIGAAAAGLAFQYAGDLAGCNNNPDPPNSDGDKVGVNGCSEVDVAGTLYSGVDDQPMGGPLGSGILKIVSHAPNPATGRYEDGVMWTLIAYDGSERIYNADYNRGKFVYIKPGAGGSCLGSSTPEPPLPPDAIGKPTDVVDGDCTWTFTPKDSYIDASGAVRVYYVVEANNDACGGPFAYWSGPDGPTPVNPNPPDESPDPIPPPEPCPCEPGDGPGGNCPDPCPDIPAPIQLPERLYKLTGICETVPEGQDQPEYEYPIPANRFELALAQRLDVIASMLQRHLSLKTPTCPPEPCPLEGDYRTISFISDEVSPEGKRRLSKRFRYRSSSGVGLSGVVEHWRSFTWQAGAVIVTHTGSALGAPKVWAATAEEGKRVIRHAAGEAGVNADQVGRWIVSGSSDPRFGMPGTMRVNTKGGYYWITSRLGPDQRPLVQET